jgi:hypothetical protein
MVRRAPKPSDIAEHQIQTMSVERLLLDKDNPRLSSTAGQNGFRDQFDILRSLWTEMAVDELVLSIAANGYFPEEPLFVIPEHPDADPHRDDTRFIVVEGNRRLAAVLILLKDEWRIALRATNMPVIAEGDKEKLRQLPVSIYEDRRELWTYLSFRHINSPKPWDSFSKAKYVAHVHDDYGISLPEIAKRIGDRHATVERLYRGYKVLKQAEERGIFDRQDRERTRFYFSHLYTALDYTEFQHFLGITENNFLDDSPVPDSHLVELSELMIWLYGKKSDGIQPVVQKQNPDLNYLRDVINKPIALDALRSGYSLEKSFTISIGDERRFREALVSARQELQQASATVTTGYEGDSDNFQRIQDIQDIARSLYQAMKRKYDKLAARR